MTKSQAFPEAMRLLSQFKTNPFDECVRPTNFGYRKACEGTYFVETGSLWHMVWDNGGEIGIDVLNSGKTPRYVQASFLFGDEPSLSSVANLASRIADVLRGDDIDYETTWTEEESNMLAHDGVPS